MFARARNRLLPLRCSSGRWLACGAGACAFFAIAVVVAAPSRAQSPAPAAGAATVFDGTYVGVSAKNDSRGNTLRGDRDRPVGYAGARACTTFRAPARLTIASALARVKWGQYMLRGSPTPEGRLTMTTGYGQKFTGQIDNQHTITGQLVGYCAYTLTWRKVQ